MSADSALAELRQVVGDGVPDARLREVLAGANHDVSWAVNHFYEAPAPFRSGRISSDLDALDALHARTGWTPGADHIRPTAVMRAQKELAIANIQSMWASNADWVYHHVFGMAAARSADGRRVSARPEVRRLVLATQPFPYELPSGTRHAVLWMHSPAAESASRAGWMDDHLTAAIGAALARYGGGDFGWYDNPKPSVVEPTLSHVQVFWRPFDAVAAAAFANAEVPLDTSRLTRPRRSTELC